jgi:hypothetical protein
MPPQGGHTMTDRGKRIITEYVYPAIPVRDWDWSAVRDGYELGDPIGRGPTENAAIRDLLDREDEEGA